MATWIQCKTYHLLKKLHKTLLQLYKKRCSQLATRNQLKQMRRKFNNLNIHHDIEQSLLKYFV
jgi:hypothetical protein